MRRDGECVPSTAGRRERQFVDRWPGLVKSGSKDGRGSCKPRISEASNAWIAGGGSGHGYKLGPALGEMLAEQVLGEREKEPFFGLARFAG